MMTPLFYLPRAVSCVYMCNIHSQMRTLLSSLFSPLQLHENVYLPDPDDLEEGGVAEAVAAALGQCDVACFLYDTSDSLSFSSAASLYVSCCTFTSMHWNLETLSKNTPEMRTPTPL